MVDLRGFLEMHPMACGNVLKRCMRCKSLCGGVCYRKDDKWIGRTSYELSWERGGVLWGDDPSFIGSIISTYSCAIVVEGRRKTTILWAEDALMCLEFLGDNDD